MRFTLGGGVSCELGTLIDTRLLVQANSGGGKSWTLRRILEQTYGHVQQLIIDPEGEFGTLREEKRDYVYAARSGGDTGVDPRSAKLLAERLLELGVSAILDIYELKAHDRIRFVRAFLEAMIDAPKALWHPVIVVVDEAHVYCPQIGNAESAGAVIDLCTRGRKRGFCAVLATQRISKLHKDAAAELNNKLIGRTALDVDMARAGEELGFSGRDERLKLRSLPAGQFFAFGPAFTPSHVTTAMIGGVESRHPKAGHRIATVTPPPTAKIKGLLPKLADLPAEAEERQQSLDTLTAENTRLRRELAAKRTAEVVEKVKVVERRIPFTPEKELAAVEQAFERFREAAREVPRPQDVTVDAPPQTFRRGPTVRSSAAPTSVKPQPGDYLVEAGRKGGKTALHTPRSNGSIGKGERAVLTAIAQHTEGCTREQLTVLTGYKRSSRDTYLQRLREQGLIEADGDRLVAIDPAYVVLGSDFEPLPTGDALQTYWRGRLTGGEQKILELLCQNHPMVLTRDEITHATGYKRSSRDTFLQRLGSRRLVDATREGVKASNLLFG